MLDKNAVWKVNLIHPVGDAGACKYGMGLVIPFIPYYLEEMAVMSTGAAQFLYGSFVDTACGGAGDSVSALGSSIRQVWQETDAREGYDLRSDCFVLYGDCQYSQHIFGAARTSGHIYGYNSISDGARFGAYAGGQNVVRAPDL